MIKLTFLRDNFFLLMRFFFFLIVFLFLLFLFFVFYHMHFVIGEAGARLLISDCLFLFVIFSNDVFALSLSFFFFVSSICFFSTSLIISYSSLKLWLVVGIRSILPLIGHGKISLRKFWDYELVFRLAIADSINLFPDLLHHLTFIIYIYNKIKKYLLKEFKKKINFKSVK